MLKRVLFVHQSAELYGSDKVLLNLVAGCLRHGVDCRVLLPEEGPLASRLRDVGAGVEVFDVLKLSRAVFSPLGLIGLLGRVPKALRGLDRLLDGWRPDVVHSNTTAVLLGALWARVKDIKHVWHVHEMVLQPRLAAWAFPRLVNAMSDHVVFISKANAALMTREVPALQAKSTVIHNGVEMGDALVEASSAARAATLAANGLSPNALIVGLVGRINAWKGHKLVVQAMSELALQVPELPTWQVWFVGSAPPGQPQFEQELRECIAATTCPERFVITPFQEQISAIWEAIDVALVPSTEPEPFGMVALEAMVHGKPVVAASHGGLLDIFEQPGSGVMFTPGDAGALALAVEGLLTHPDLRVNVGMQGWQRARAHFSLQAQLSHFLRVLTVKP